MTQAAPASIRDRAGGRIEWALLQTAAYFSLFDYTPSLFELHRYLHGESATPEDVRDAWQRLDARRYPATPHARARWLRSVQGTTIPMASAGAAHADEGVHTRPRLSFPQSGLGRRPSFAPVLGLPSRPVDRRLRVYLTILKYLPFVRMIGLTGSKAVDPAGDGDTDLMIVAARGRVWLCRLGAVAVARFARRFGDRLCPNYVVSEDSLALPEMSIYDAHELAQLIPLYGRSAYQELWARNSAIGDLLPNSYPFTGPIDRLPLGAGRLKRALERALGGRLGDRLERWERTRKIGRLRALGVISPEISLTSEQCKGHFDGHRTRILSAYDHLLSRLGRA